MHARHALVRRPSTRLSEGLITHIERSEHVDIDLAVKQWEDYCTALTAQGWITHEVAPLDACADSVFVEDTMVVYGDLAVIARPGARERRPEIVEAEQAVRARGYRIAHIEKPGTLDGGDVLKHDGHVWVGVGGRTNRQGVEQLRLLLEPLGAEVTAVPVAKVLHLKSGVTALPDGTVIGFAPLVDDISLWGDRFLAMPEPSGAHVVVLDDRTVLMAASAPGSAALLASRGLDVVAVDISEFEKLEGCVTCLSVRLRGVPDR